MRKIKAWFYNLIRPVFVMDIDPNEDFKCGWCSEPVLRRVLFCSDACSFLSERADLQAIKELSSSNMNEED